MKEFKELIGKIPFRGEKGIYALRSWGYAFGDYYTHLLEL